MIIGIGGVSRAGKSTLSELLQKRFEQIGKSTAIIEQDKYINKVEDIPKIRDKTDWESPLSINFAKFKKAILDS